MVTHRQSFLGKVLYGAVFVVLLPALLLAWTVVLDRSIGWSVPWLPIAALSGMLTGLFLLLKGMLDLTHFGRGLPMNAYPPPQFVTQGVYSWFSHPIYVGAILLAAGTALWFRSSAGLSVVVPILALMELSLVYGYEQPNLEKRFGSIVRQYRPLFSLPLPTEQPASWSKKLAMGMPIFLPWLVIGYFVDAARCTQTCDGAFLGLGQLRLASGWVGLLWVLPYLTLAMLLIGAPTQQQLRRRAIAGTLATVVGLYLYVFLPPFGIPLRATDWSLPLANLVVVVLALNYRALWSGMQRIAERIGNSRRDWLFANGRFRIINHSLYSGAAGAVAVGILGYITGNPLAALLLLVCGLVGAAVFAQVLWGSRSLVRPFGYWGAVIGVAVGVLLVWLLFGIPFVTIAVAAVLCAPFAQAIGRLRCLAQGCCHGTVTDPFLGIRIWQPQSRVVALSGLKGQYILATQLYSILFNIPLGLLLWSLWLSHSVSSSLLVGLYFILTGIERFTEDAYRGEKQTRFLKGLRENQWIALGAVLVGIATTMIPSALPARPVASVDLAYVAAAVIGGLVTAFAMSMDFPTSTMRFSRLSG